ncbi:unnamed protein product [Calypogeia fissa]
MDTSTQRIFLPGSSRRSMLVSAHAVDATPAVVGGKRLVGRPRKNPLNPTPAAVGVKRPVGSPRKNPLNPTPAAVVGKRPIGRPEKEKQEVTKKGHPMQPRRKATRYTICPHMPTTEIFGRECVGGQCFREWMDYLIHLLTHAVGLESRHSTKDCNGSGSVNVPD